MSSFPVPEVLLFAEKKPLVLEESGDSDPDHAYPEKRTLSRNVFALSAMNSVSLQCEKSTSSTLTKLHLLCVYYISHCYKNKKVGKGGLSHDLGTMASFST